VHIFQNNSTVISPASSRRQALAEIALIFAIFFAHGAWPVPDVNEAHYLGKAIHYWNPGWLAGDFFMESPDTHKVFYFTFGWMSLWLSPTVFAWTGRVISWWLLAWAWRRLSWAVVPRPWCAVLTAALFGLLMERFHLAGEWVIGGFEAKPLAYVLVLLALEALVRNRWNLALALLGAASAMHVLVGGWVAIAAAIAWLYLKFGNSPRPLPGEGPGVREFDIADESCLLPCSIPDTAESYASKAAVCPHPLPLSRERARGDETPPSHAPRPQSSIPLPWPGILIGLLLALPGIVPSLMLDWGTDRETILKAHEIYVFDRLPHHLLLTSIYPSYIARMSLLIIFWLLLGRWNTEKTPVIRRLRAVVVGAIVIALIGAAMHLLLLIDRGLAVGLLRFYWFRLLDFAMPLGVALEGVLLLSRLTAAGMKQSRWLWALAVIPAALNLVVHIEERIWPEPPRSHKLADYEAWREACAWIARPGNVPPDARFLIPRLAQSFKWYTGHDDVVVWKDMPQDARGIVEWRRRIDDIYATGRTLRSQRWHEPPSKAGTARLRELAEKYHADYLITERCDPPPDLDQVYGNRTYVIYRLR
jgi:hypothetical protein